MPVSNLTKVQAATNIVKQFLGDATHGGQLTRKKIIDKNGNLETKWVKTTGKLIAGSKPPKSRQVKTNWFDTYKSYNLNKYPIGIPQEQVTLKLHGDINSHAVMTWKDPKTGKQQDAYTFEFLERNKENKWKRTSLITESIVANIKQKCLQGLQSGVPKTAQSAAVIFIIANTGLRVGSEDAFNKTGNQGVTTLHPNSVTVKGDVVDFKFVGKSYHTNSSKVKNKKLAALITTLKQQAAVNKSNFLFPDVDRADVDRIFKVNFGGNAVDGMKIKDLRTYKATELSMQFLYQNNKDLKLSGNPKKDTKVVAFKLKQLYEYVSSQLNNSPSMTKGAYINPKIRERWLADIGFVDTRNIFKAIVNKSYVVPTLDQLIKSDPPVSGLIYTTAFANAGEEEIADTMFNLATFEESVYS